MDCSTEPTLAVLDPSAIDEHRFDYEQSPSTREITLRSLMLLPRWRSPAHLAAQQAELLWAPVSDAELDFVEQPFPAATNPDRDPADPDAFWSADSAETLLLLRSEIERQRRWRLRLMVNHADEALFVYRPFGTTAGRLREGAEEEIRILQQLIRHQDNLDEPATATAPRRSGRRLIVFHPPQDEERRALSGLIDHLTNGLVNRVHVPSGAENLAGVFRPVVLRCLREPDDGVGRLELAREFLTALAHVPDAEHSVGLTKMNGTPLSASEADRHLRGLGDELRRCIKGLTGDQDLYNKVVFEEAHWVAALTSQHPTDLVDAYLLTWRDARASANPPAESRGDRLNDASALTSSET